MRPDRKRFRCRDCGGETVDKRVAYEWDPKLQEWEPNFMKLEFKCRACGSEEPGIELHAVRAANVLLSGFEIGRLEEAVHFYLEHAKVPQEDIDALDGVLNRLEEVPIIDREFDPLNGEEWQGPTGAHLESSERGGSGRSKVRSINSSYRSKASFQN